MKKGVRYFLAQKRWLKSVPNILTVGNSLCGFAAILIALQAYKDGIDRRIIFELSAWLIVGAMLFDALDGFAARILHAASLKGIQMDSLADMVTFGVAPAVLVSVMAHIYLFSHLWHLIIWVSSGFYIACTAHRLAQYNVMTMVEKKTSHKFYGLPSPGAAAAICSIVFFIARYDFYMYMIKLLPFYTAFLGFLMVSNIRYRHIGKWLVNTKRNKSRFILIAIIVISLFIKPDITVIGVITIYIFWGLIADLYDRIIGRIFSNNDKKEVNII